MKKQHFLVLLGVAIVLGLAGVLFEMSRSSGWNESKTDRRIFSHLPVDEIQKIQLRSGDQTVILERKVEDWKVVERNDYPADFEKIRSLIRTLWELKAGQEMQIGPSQLARLQLVAPGQGEKTGIEIELKGKDDKILDSLIIGKSMDQSDGENGGMALGRFVYNPAVKDRVYLTTEQFVSLNPLSAGQWLDKTFIKPGEIKQIEQAPWSNNPGWKITRENDKADWKLDNATPQQKLDSAFTQSFSNFTPSFTDVRPRSTPQTETGFSDPFRIKLSTFDGFNYEFVVGKEGPEKARYLQLKVTADLPERRVPEQNETPEDKKKRDEEFSKNLAGLKQRLAKEQQFEQWIYLVPDWNLESLLKRRDEILAKPAPTPTPSP